TRLRSIISEELPRAHSLFFWQDRRSIFRQQVCRQLRSVPISTQGFDQEHSTHHAPTQDIDRCHFVCECSVLGGDHLQIGRDSAPVTPSGGLQRLFSGPSGLGLHLSFLFKDAQRCDA